MEEFSEGKPYHRLLINLASVPLYLVFAWLGLFFVGHIPLAVLVFVLIGGVVDVILHRQTVASLERKYGGLPVRPLLKGVMARHLGVILVLILCVASAGYVL